MGEQNPISGILGSYDAEPSRAKQTSGPSRILGSSTLHVCRREPLCPGSISSSDGHVDF